ncbi:cupin domain-containing protein [Billgrantia saliphila]|uniref:cupin domain-containing protein n=1 Tax=Billgrantia saliphila TaxID=1848458 RepID=UPI000CE4AB73|nr:cupin domain-containing protein [Halomonas saliphila]
MFLSAQDIEALEGVRKVHLLNAQAVRINKSLGDAVGMTQLGIHMISVPPGHFSTEYHCHRYEEEAIYVLSGCGVATLGDWKQPIAPGDFIGCPTNGVAHEMYNDGNEPLVCLVMGQRLAQDVSDYPRLGKRLYRNSGEWDLVDCDAIVRVQR